MISLSNMFTILRKISQFNYRKDLLTFLDIALLLIIIENFLMYILDKFLVKDHHTYSEIESYYKLLLIFHYHSNHFIKWNKKT